MPWWSYVDTKPEPVRHQCLPFPMLRVTLFFAFLGPLLGSIGLMCVSGFMFLLHQDGLTFGAAVGIFLVGGLFFGSWGYIVALPLGFFPAALTGLTYAAFLRWRGRRGNPHVAIRLLTGAILGFMYAASSDMVVGFLTARQPEHGFSVAVLGPAGAFAGAFCASLIRQRSYDRIVRRGT